MYSDETAGAMTARFFIEKYHNASHFGIVSSTRKFEVDALDWREDFLALYLGNGDR